MFPGWRGRAGLVAAVQFLPGMTRLRLALAAAALPLLSACTAIIPIEVTRQLTLESPGGAFSAAKAVDFSAEASVWSHRDDVDAVSVDELTATVVSVGPAHQAEAVTLHLAFRPDGAPADGGQDLQVGALTSLPFVVGASVTLPGSAALDAFLLDALKGSGRFTAVASGVLAGPASAVIEITLKGSAAYKVAGK